MSKKYPIDGCRDALWRDTAVEEPKTDRLGGALTVDVAIVGAGFVGLNAAIDLADAGRSVAVFDAERLGFGGSGRSGGQVNIGLNASPSELIDLYGQAQAARTVQLVAETAKRFFARVDNLGLSCDAVQAGCLFGAANQAVLDGQKRLAERFSQHGEPYEIWDAASVQQRAGVKVGAGGYVGGLAVPSSGSIQPLSYTFELARVALSKGARIFTHSPVESYSRTAEGWALTAGGQTVRAGQIIIATNGYSDDLVPGLKQTLIPIRSALAATEPLSEALRSEILPGEVTFVDKRRLTLYVRYDRDGRLAVGDRGPMRDAFCAADFEALKARALQVWPQLKGVRWSHHWGGRIAMTRSHLPFMWQPEPGVLVGTGCNGRGVAMGTMIGMNLARAVDAALSGEGTPELDLPQLDLPLTRPKRYPLHRFHPLGAEVRMRLAGWQDAREQGAV